MQVDGSTVAYTDNTSGNAISVDLTTKVAARSKITVLFDSDAPTTQDLTGVTFLSTVSMTPEPVMLPRPRPRVMAMVMREITIPGPSPRRMRVRRSLVGLWNFDEGSGQTAADSTANNNYATLGTAGGAEANDPVWVCVNGGYALSFDGTDDIVNAGSAASLDDLEPMTIAAWIKPDSAGSSGYSNIVAKKRFG